MITINRTVAHKRITKAPGDLEEGCRSHAGFRVPRMRAIWSRKAVHPARQLPRNAGYERTTSSFSKAISALNNRHVAVDEALDIVSRYDIDPPYTCK